MSRSCHLPAAQAGQIHRCLRGQRPREHDGQHYIEHLIAGAACGILSGLLIWALAAALGRHGSEY